MSKSTRVPSGRATIAALVIIGAGLVLTLGALVPLRVQADPPADQTYTGAKRCASCHFDQYMAWKKTKHAAAFDVLTAKYQSDQTCLKCHTTGLGEATGFKDFATTAALAGVTCETCHGPGSKHDEIAEQFKTVKQLSPEQEQQVRGSIWKVIPRNICIECHVTQGHKPSLTPKELQPAK